MQEDKCHLIKITINYKTCKDTHTLNNSTSGIIKQSIPIFVFPVRILVQISPQTTSANTDAVLVMLYITMCFYVEKYRHILGQSLLVHKKSSHVKTSLRNLTKEKSVAGWCLNSDNRTALLLLTIPSRDRLHSPGGNNWCSGSYSGQVEEK